MVTAEWMNAGSRAAVAGASMLVAKPAQDERFREQLQARAAVEDSVAARPKTPVAGGSVGDNPLAKMRPPVASSADDAVATTAQQEQRDAHSKASQDTGAVVVAKPDAETNKGQSEGNAWQKEDSPGAAEVGAALQQDAQPLGAIVVAANTKLPVSGKGAGSSAPAVDKSATAAKKDSCRSGAVDSAVVSEAGPVVAQLPVMVVPKVVEAKTQTLPEPEMAPVALKDLKDESAIAKPAGALLKKTESKVAAAAGSEGSIAGVAVAPGTQQVSVATAAVGPANAVAGVAIGGHVTHVQGTSSNGVTSKVAESGTSPYVAAAVPVRANTDLRTLVSTPNVLEIGFASGSHGWLKVRAELDGTGEVAASVVAASAGAAEGLHKELPGLSQYLAGEDVAVSSLVVNAAGKGVEAQDAAMSFGGGQAQAGGRQGARQGESSGEAQTSAGLAGVAAEWTEFEGGWDRAEVPAAMLARGSGSWLSVRV